MKKLVNNTKDKVSDNIFKKPALKPLLLNGMLKERKGHFWVLGIIFIAIMLLLWLLGRYGMLI